jgi:hypothetical protein
MLTALEIELLFQILTNRIQAFQANAVLISKSFVQFSSQDPKYSSNDGGYLPTWEQVLLKTRREEISGNAFGLEQNEA